MIGELEFEPWEVSQAIKIARTIAGLSQEQLARLASIVGQHRISQFETGNDEASPLELAEMFSACGFELIYKLRFKNRRE